MAWLCVPGLEDLNFDSTFALGDSYRTVGDVEREASAATTLVARMEDKALGFAPVWDDLKTFDGRAWRGRVDIITAGYPCQPFSVAGRRKGEADPRHLWPHVARVIRECEPRFVFLENVSNHLRLGFRSVAEDLRHMGYRVAATVLRAEEVGAPHRRERLFVLAHSEGFDRQSGPASRAFAPGPPGSVDPVAHAAQQRQREPHNAARAEPRENTRSDSGGGSSTVADSECSKRRSLGAACDGGSEGFGARGQADRGDWSRKHTTWTTPQTHDVHPGNAARVRRYGTKHGGANLTDDVQTFHPDPQSKIDGITCWCNTPNCGQQSHKQRLNPLFVEWMMGWPRGWTGFAPVETESWLFRQRSRLSCLLENFIEGKSLCPKDEGQSRTLGVLKAGELQNTKKLLQQLELTEQIHSVTLCR